MSVNLKSAPNLQTLGMCGRAQAIKDGKKAVTSTRLFSKEDHKLKQAHSWIINSLHSILPNITSKMSQIEIQATVINSLRKNSETSNLTTTEQQKIIVKISKAVTEKAYSILHPIKNNYQAAAAASACAMSSKTAEKLFEELDQPEKRVRFASQNQIHTIPNRHDTANSFHSQGESKTVSPAPVPKCRATPPPVTTNGEAKIYKDELYDLILSIQNKSKQPLSKEVTEKLNSIMEINVAVFRLAYGRADYKIVIETPSKTFIINDDNIVHRKRRTSPMEHGDIVLYLDYPLLRNILGQR